MPSPGSSNGARPSPANKSGAATTMAVNAARSAASPGDFRFGGPASEPGSDRRQENFLHRLVRRGQRLVLVDPQDALAMEHAALHADRRAVRAGGLEADHQPVARPLGVDAV